MNLETLKNTIKKICLEHVEVKQFNFGETFDVIDGGANNYPFCFLEIPYFINYPINKITQKEINFALILIIFHFSINYINYNQYISL